jgi:hypothetical protein
LRPKSSTASTRVKSRKLRRMPPSCALAPALPNSRSRDSCAMLCPSLRAEPMRRRSRCVADASSALRARARGAPPSGRSRCCGFRGVLLDAAAPPPAAAAAAAAAAGLVVASPAAAPAAPLADAGAQAAASLSPRCCCCWLWRCERRPLLLPPLLLVVAGSSSVCCCRGTRPSTPTRPLT